jgi:glycosyltransferase involved in cell wall biosynthesis
VLNLPANKKIILLCADGGASDPRKGAHLLTKALQSFHERNPELAASSEVLILGQERNRSFQSVIKSRFAGRLVSDLELRLHYAAADVVVIPSIQDNLPLVGIEAHACGTPAVGFRIGGLPDIISHHNTGALAEPLDAESLANEVIWVLEDSARGKVLGINAREKAERVWSPTVTSRQYCELYHRLAGGKNNSGT